MGKNSVKSKPAPNPPKPVSQAIGKPEIRTLPPSPEVVARHPQAAHLRSWAPGQSGNPSGRPKLNRDLQALARELTEEAVSILGILMRSAEDERTRAFCACAILDRGHGRPREQKEKDEKLVEGWDAMSYTERIAELRAQRGALPALPAPAAPGPAVTEDTAKGKS